MNIYGHHPSQIEDELKRLMNEKARDRTFAKNQFRRELRIALQNEKEFEQISSRISMRLFTQHMMNVGERIIRELGENGRPVGN